MVRPRLLQYEFFPIHQSSHDSALYTLRLMSQKPVGGWAKSAIGSESPATISSTFWTSVLIWGRDWRTLNDYWLMLPSDIAGCPIWLYQRVLWLLFRLLLSSNKELFPTRFLHQNSVQFLVPFIVHTSSPPTPLDFFTLSISSNMYHLWTSLLHNILICLMSWCVVPCMRVTQMKTLNILIGRVNWKT